VPVSDADPASLIRVPDNALYYAALGCVEVALRENRVAGLYTGADKLKHWVETGQTEEKKKLGRKRTFQRYSRPGELQS